MILITNGAILRSHEDRSKIMMLHYACSWRTLINLLMKLQLVYDFVNHFSLCSDGETHQVQVIPFDTANSITIGAIMGGRKHLFRIKSRLYSSCKGAIKHPC